MESWEGCIIFHGTAQRLQKCEFVAHACLIQHPDQCPPLIDYICTKYQSPVRNPYVRRLRSFNSSDEIMDDCGDFGSAQIISSCIQHAEHNCGGFRFANILVLVTCKVKGCFVVDMIQHLKHRPIMVSCQSALAQLAEHLEKLYPSKSRQKLHTAQIDSIATSPVNTVTFDPASIGIPDCSTRQTKSNKF